ncbi:MAG: GtrA family protein [Muribaculaceae bacterium]|nr:GtrA family protein [Muribaculaceae bacterium]
MKLSAENRYVQFVKYCLVGVLNTLVTFGVIYICKSFFGLNLYLCNALGYIAGLVNSFVCNKQWVFHSRGGYRREALVFALGFLLCYGVQLLTVWLINTSPIGSVVYNLTPRIAISGYGIATLIGNIVYTVANFIYNKFVTFR